MYFFIYLLIMCSRGNNNVIYCGVCVVVVLVIDVGLEEGMQHLETTTK